MQVPALELGGKGHVAANLNNHRNQLHCLLPLSMLPFVKGYSPGMVPKFGRLVKRGRNTNGAKAVHPETPRSHPAAAAAAQDLVGGLSPLVARRLAGQLGNVHKPYLDVSSVGLSSADPSNPCSPSAPGRLSDTFKHSLYDDSAMTAFQWKPTSDASHSSSSTAQPGTPEAQAPMMSHRRSTGNTESAGDAPKHRNFCGRVVGGASYCNCGAANIGSDYGAGRATTVRERSVETAAFEALSEALSYDSDSDSNRDYSDYGSHPSSSSHSLQSVQMLSESELHSAVHRSSRRRREHLRSPLRTYSEASQPEDFSSLLDGCTPRTAAHVGTDVVERRSRRRRPDPGPARSGSEVPIASPGVMARLTSDEVARLQGFADGAQVCLCLTEGRRAPS